MQRGRIIVVALHAGAVTRDRDHGHRVARADVGAAESVTGDQHHSANAGRRAGAGRLADALYAERSGLGGACALLRVLPTSGSVGIDQVEIGKLARQQRRVREARELILRRDSRHRDRTFGERIRAIALHVVGGNHRLAFAHQHAQAHVVAFGALAFLDRPIAHFDRQRHRAHRDRVGRIRARAPRSLNQAFGKFDERGLVEQV